MVKYQQLVFEHVKMHLINIVVNDLMIVEYHINPNDIFHNHLDLYNLHLI